MQGLLTVMDSVVPFIVFLVNVGQNNSEAEVCTVMAYISSTRVHTPLQDLDLYL